MLFVYKTILDSIPVLISLLIDHDDVGWPPGGDLPGLVVSDPDPDPDPDPTLQNDLDLSADPDKNLRAADDLEDPLLQVLSQDGWSPAFPGLGVPVLQFPAIRCDQVGAAVRRCLDDHHPDMKVMLDDPSFHLAAFCRWVGWVQSYFLIHFYLYWLGLGLLQFSWPFQFLNVTCFG